MQRIGILKPAKGYTKKGGLKVKRKREFFGAKVLSMLVVTLLLCLPSLAKADAISPASFSATLGVGESTTITKTVTVDSTGSPKVDVYFLADTTGSMHGSIAGIKAAASTILSSAAGLGDVSFAVGEYKDSYDPYRYRLNTAMTSSTAAAQGGINLWNASGGHDAPEANFYALDHAASDAATGWRSGSERIMVWFGDAPGHNPDGGSSEASATAALVGAGIQVEAINVTTFTSFGFNLDLCSGYYCGASGEGGAATSGQATRITNATGGNLYTSTNTSAIVSVINNAISSAVGTYSSVSLDLSGAPAGVSVTSSPAAHGGSWDRSVSRTFDFDVTFTGDTAGTYDFSIDAMVDGGIVATESDHIVVSSAAVPEPSTLLLLGSGLAGLAFIRRKVA